MLIILILLILVKNTDYKTKINRIENKITDHVNGKYITTQ